MIPLLKILIVTAGIISVGYFFFSDITLANILIKVALVGVFLVCIYLLPGRQRRVKIFTTEHSADNNVSEKGRGVGGNKENGD